MASLSAPVETGSGAHTPQPRRLGWRRSASHVVLAGLGVLAVLACLALVLVLLMARQFPSAAGVLALLGAAVWVYLSPRLYAWRYVLPGLLAALVFILFPMAYTLGISFTNYSSDNLLSFERSTQVLLERSDSSGESVAVAVHAVPGGHRFVFTDDQEQRWISPVVPLASWGAAQAHPEPHKVPLEPVGASPAPELAFVLAAEPLDLKTLIALKPALQQVVALWPAADGSLRELRASSLRRFAVSRPAYSAQPGGVLRANADGKLYKPNFKTGFWETEQGQRVEPGFRTQVGLENYVRIFKDPRFLDPFVRVFSWTLSFASLNTLFTFALGLVLAVVLNWDALKGRNFYRAMLFLPYAVPAFISIPVFRGLFNENLGEINLILDHLFGIRPGWFSDATLARSMVLIVNTWLGYPYMMILCMGLIKAIPGELYEASALAGAGPLTNFFRITLPLIMRPMAPLLIASFAANFNNLTLIALLTGGAPDYLDTQVPVGATDLLASYTYRIAFQDSGQNYALACAISSLVFLLVATLAVVNLKLFKVGRSDAA